MWRQSILAVPDRSGDILFGPVHMVIDGVGGLRQLHAVAVFEPTTNLWFSGVQAVLV